MCPPFWPTPHSPTSPLTDGSSIRLTYRTATGLPADVALAAASQTYVVTEENYQAAWESDNDYVNAFAPSKPASRFIPALLAAAYPDAAEGDLVVANYQEADTDPVFNAVPGPDEPSWQPSEVIGSLATGDQADITAYVTGICGAGFIVTDATGSIFVYMGSSFDSSSYAIGDQVTISGTIGAYNRGLQVTGSSADIEITGKGTYEYPAPVAYTGAALDAALARTDNEGAIYGTMTGTVKVSGNNINILVEGAETAQGGIYYATDEQKALPDRRLQGDRQRLLHRHRRKPLLQLRCHRDKPCGCRRRAQQPRRSSADRFVGGQCHVPLLGWPLDCRH